VGWLVGAFLLLWVAWGPAVVVLVAAALCVPRVRWWVQDRTYVSRRVVGWVSAAVAALVAVVVVVPDGWLPIPPAPGAWAGPSYVGRPASPHAVTAAEVPQNPHRAAGAPVTRPGPLGLQPEVETSWFGLQHCGRLELTSSQALLALCTDRSGPSLRLVDAETLRPTTSLDLPEPSADEACAGDELYLDATDRAVVAADRQVLVVRTTSAEGEAQLARDAAWDLKPYVPYRDCLVALAPDWAGRIWWASRQGLVGTIAPDTGEVRVIDLYEDVRRGLVEDDSGSVYVVTDESLQRLTAGPDGTPTVAWRTAYSGTSGTPPVLVDGGAVAITDTQDSRLGVVFVSRESGAQICRQPVFEKGDGATVSPLAPLGRGVAVTNNHDYSSPRSTMLGFTSSPGIARVDLVDGACVERWTSDAVSPSSGVTASWPNGLVYAWTKRPALSGVSTWYLTALDAETGRSMWGVRTGTGLLAGSDHATVSIGPDASAWMGTLAGLVRVTDRRSSG
jgi:hypothetical protein